MTHLLMNQDCGDAGNYRQCFTFGRVVEWQTQLTQNQPRKDCGFDSHLGYQLLVNNQIYKHMNTLFVIAIIAAVAGAAYYFFLLKKEDSSSTTPPAPAPEASASEENQENNPPTTSV
jgi:hypothetical protein